MTTVRTILINGMAVIGVIGSIGIAFLGLLTPATVQAQQAAAVTIDNDDIGGVVTGPAGPEEIGRAHV